MSRVVLVGLSKKDAEAMARVYAKVGTPCEIMPNVDVAFERIPENPPALVVMNYDGKLESVHGLSDVLKTNAPVTALLAVLPDSKMETAIKVLRAGAFDCLSHPLKPLDILAASKRATLQKGRMLFAAQVRCPERKWTKVLAAAASAFILGGGFLKVFYGPPLDQISLASAHLAGLQWEDRSLWVGDWFDSNILCYKVSLGLAKKFRELSAVALYKMADGQPMLLCNTPNALVTVGTDLKLRSHQRLVGLPSVQTAAMPGTNPTGLVWDGKNIWTSDLDQSALYRYGDDFRVLDTVKSIIPNPSGLAYYDNSLWVLGGAPLRLARLEKVAYGYVWRGPYPVKNLLLEGVAPSGMSVGFERLWLVSGGYPMMVSSSLKEITGEIFGWHDRGKSKGAG